MALPGTSKANRSVLISDGKVKTGPNHDFLSTETQVTAQRLIKIQKLKPWPDSSPLLE